MTENVNFEIKYCLGLKEFEYMIDLCYVIFFFEMNQHVQTFTADYTKKYLYKSTFEETVIL